MSFAAAAQPSSGARAQSSGEEVDDGTGAEIDGVAVELTDDAPSTESPVRALPVPRTASELEAWRGELRTVAVVAAGSLAAGVVTVAAAGVAKSVGSRTARRSLRRKRERDIVASRSFLVDVHLLGR